jgi:magnesium-transporting ATPase (P-type)
MPWLINSEKNTLAMTAQKSVPRHLPATSTLTRHAGITDMRKHNNLPARLPPLENAARLALQGGDDLKCA